MKQRTVKSAEGRWSPVEVCLPFVRKHRRLKHEVTLGLSLVSKQNVRLVEVRLRAFRNPIPTTHFAQVQVI